MGRSLENENLPEMLAGEAGGVRDGLTTSGFLLTEDYSRRMLQAGLDLAWWLWSCHAGGSKHPAANRFGLPAYPDQVEPWSKCGTLRKEKPAVKLSFP